MEKMSSIQPLPLAGQAFSVSSVTPWFFVCLNCCRRLNSCDILTMMVFSRERVIITTLALEVESTNMFGQVDHGILTDQCGCRTIAKSKNCQYCPKIKKTTTELRKLHQPFVVPLFRCGSKCLFSWVD